MEPIQDPHKVYLEYVKVLYSTPAYFNSTYSPLNQNKSIKTKKTQISNDCCIYLLPYRFDTHTSYSTRNMQFCKKKKYINPPHNARDMYTRIYILQNDEHKTHSLQKKEYYKITRQQAWCNISLMRAILLYVCLKFTLFIFFVCFGCTTKEARERERTPRRILAGVYVLHGTMLPVSDTTQGR